jgi:hypothetical protein
MQLPSLPNPPGPPAHPHTKVPTKYPDLIGHPPAHTQTKDSHALPNLMKLTHFYALRPPAVTFPANNLCNILQYKHLTK